MAFNDKAWHVGFKWTIGDPDNNTGAICLDESSDALHICDINDATTNWNVSSTSHPTVYVHSASNPATDYVRTYHDGTNGIIDCDGTTIFSMTASTLAIIADVTVTGGVTWTGASNVTLTDPTTADDAFFGYIDAGGAWTSGNMVGLRGQVAISGSNNYVSATGVWAGIDFATATGTGTGLIAAINAEVSSNNSTRPNAIVYLQSLPATNANFSEVPFIAFTETGAGTGSGILFELGHVPAGSGSYVTTGASGIFNTTTLKIKVNANDRYLPMSTVTDAYTTAAVITTSNATASTTTGTGALIVTGGVGIGGAVFTGGLLTSNSTTGFRSLPTFDPDSTYSNYGLAIGTNASALAVTFAEAANENFNPVQLNFTVSSSGSGPTHPSQMNVIYAKIAHNTTDSAGLRLKCADFLVTTNKNVRDMYAYQGEIDITGDSAIDGEAAVMGLVLDVGTGTVSGSVNGIHMALRGSAMSACQAYGFYMSVGDSATATNGLYIETLTGSTIGNSILLGCASGTTVTRGLYIYGAGTFTTGIEISSACTTGLASAAPVNLTYGGTALNVTTSVSSADNIVEILGTSTATTGTVRSLWVSLTASGDAATQARAISTTLTISENTNYAYANYIYSSAISNKTITQMAGLFVYMEDMGNAVQHQAGISINRNISTAGTVSDCFLQMRNHGSTAATAFIKFTGKATYIWDFQNGDQEVPLSAWSSGTTVASRAAMRMPDGQVRYIHLFTS